MSDEIIPTGTAVPLSDQTAVPINAQTAVPNVGTAVPLNNKATASVMDVPECQMYDIKGKQYKMVSVISKQSGEAKIFRVENNGRDYALKIYKQHRHPDHSVLETIRNLRGNGLLVDIYEHGLWCDADGIQYDYELMQYCSGRSLASVKLNGDEAKLKEIAVRMAAAIDFCHKHHILHRDIKPSNFIYIDGEEKAFVLTDFGIGKMLDINNRTTTDEGRTPIYAAPEMYTYIPGKPTYVTPSADFYAMGMSLLALWIGEGMLIADEVKLVKDKQEETLPYPSGKISSHTLSLIKGLTRRNSENRIDFKGVVKWAKGETVYRESNNDVVRSDFRIVFSATDNLIAHSSKELSRILWENQKLAKNYLYQEQVEKWYREIEQPEIALQIHTITEDKYPGDRDAGLYATCLLLDEDMPFLGLSGNRVDTMEKITNELYEHVDEYSKQLYRPTHNLWVYLDHVGEKELVKKYTAKIKNNAESGIYQFCYELNPELPYRLKLEDRTLSISDFDHMFNLIVDEIIDNDEISKLAKEEFFVWVYAKNDELAKMIVTNLKNNNNLDGTNKGWLIAYSLGYNVGYDFRHIKGNNKSSLVTIDDIAHQIAKDINEDNQRADSLAAQIASVNFVQTRLYQYLYTRTKYAKHIHWIEYCMNLQSEANKKKYAPYTKTMAQMKTVAGLLGGYFPLEIANITINTLEDYESKKLQIDQNIQNNPLKFELLQEWIALHFHEKTNCDYTKEPYYRLISKYIEYLKDKLPVCNVASIAKNTKDKIIKAKRKFNSARTRVKLIQWFVVLFCFVPLILVSIFAIYNLYSMDPEVFRNSMEAIGSILGVVVGILLGFIVFAYTHWLIGIIVGYGTGSLISYLCSSATPYVPWILMGVLLVILFLFGKNIFVKSLSKPEDEWSDMDLELVEELACIGNAFNSRDKILSGVPADYPACVYTTSATKVNSKIGTLIRKALYMFLFTIAVCGVFGWTSLSDLDFSTDEIILSKNKIDGDYSGKFDNRNATFNIESKQLGNSNCLIGTVTIYYSKPLVHKVICYTETFDSEHPVFYLRNEDGSLDEKVKYDVQIKDDGTFMILEGVYTNAHKGSEYEFTFNRLK